jgi:predicted SAM-dependent methyltransferase
MSNNGNAFQRLKRAVAGMIGRERANQITNPYYDRQARRQTREFLANLPEGDLLLNLGCGTRPMKGWINIDRARGPEVQVVWDLADKLPFADSTCAAIFSEHVIEHLTRDAAAELLSDCCRVLRPGGVLRISTPDAERFLLSYAGDGEFLKHPSFGAPADSRLDRINQMMREYGQHLWVYDAESLTRLLRAAGFSSAVRQEFGKSVHPRMQDIDTPEREFESLYFEATK